MQVSDIREHFRKELQLERFTVDKTGAKTIELIGASFIADEPAIFGKVNHDYVIQELNWYSSTSTNINDIRPADQGPPEAWKYAANRHGEINSNYGHLIFSAKYYGQYYRALNELLSNPDSRRAIMIYNRPSIWEEFNENGKNDMICTNAVTYYIRDGLVNAVVQMRSNDVVFGYKNDYAWAYYILSFLVKDLNENRQQPEGYKIGKIHWQVQNLHVYEKHFALVNDGL